MISDRTENSLTGTYSPCIIDHEHENFIPLLFIALIVIKHNYFQKNLGHWYTQIKHCTSLIIISINWNFNINISFFFLIIRYKYYLIFILCNINIWSIRFMSTCNIYRKFVEYSTLIYILIMIWVYYTSNHSRTRSICNSEKKC